MCQSLSQFKINNIKTKKQIVYLFDTDTRNTLTDLWNYETWSTFAAWDLYVYVDVFRRNVISFAIKFIIL